MRQHKRICRGKNQRQKAIPLYSRPLFCWSRCIHSCTWTIHLWQDPEWNRWTWQAYWRCKAIQRWSGWQRTISETGNVPINDCNSSMWVCFRPQNLILVGREICRHITNSTFPFYLCFCVVHGTSAQFKIKNENVRANLLGNLVLQSDHKQ